MLVHTKVVQSQFCHQVLCLVTQNGETCIIGKAAYKAGDDEGMSAAFATAMSHAAEWMRAGRVNLSAVGGTSTARTPITTIEQYEAERATQVGHFGR
jgi:hypothetical protein